VQFYFSEKHLVFSLLYDYYYLDIYLNIEYAGGVNDMNTVFKALDDPNRRRILELLKNEDLSAGEISTAFNISKPSISHHLNILKTADLVLAERHGQNIIYSLNTTVFQEVLAWIYSLNSRKEEK